jgi:hypothetical protein
MFAPKSVPRNVLLPLAVKICKTCLQLDSGDYQIPLLPLASAWGLFYHFSANKIPLIFASVPAFDFYLSGEQGP